MSISGGDVGISALGNAVRYGRKDIAELLIQSGADVNIRNLSEDTPLHTACYKGELDVVKLLIEHGADVNARNVKGQTPLYTATLSCSNDDFTMLKVLIDAGANKSIKSKNGNKPIDLCWQEKHKPKREFLKSYGKADKKWWRLFLPW
jgi:ankyrin repeat protein